MATLRDQLLQQQAEITRKLSILNSIDEDTFNFGTVMVFDYGQGLRDYYVKVAEERWKHIKSNNQKALSDWIFDTEEGPQGYFEVYQLVVQPVPFYASTD